MKELTLDEANERIVKATQSINDTYNRCFELSQEYINVIKRLTMLTRTSKLRVKTH